jgi:hypothetical protein
MDYLVHLAYVLYLISYSVRDMVWLRALTIVASIVLLPYYQYQSPPMYVPMVWLTLFTLINGVQVVILILERRPVNMSDEDAELYGLAFHTMPPREFLKLYKLADWQDAPQGERIVEQGRAVGGVLLLTHGRVRIDLNGREIAEMLPGQFVGEMSYLTDEVASAQVTALESSRCVFWPSEQLERFFALNADLKGTFMAILGVDLVTKVKQRIHSA